LKSTVIQSAPGLATTTTGAKALTSSPSRPLVEVTRPSKGAFRTERASCSSSERTETLAISTFFWATWTSKSAWPTAAAVCRAS
jgi:hypothetical protein